MARVADVSTFLVADLKRFHLRDSVLMLAGMVVILAGVRQASDIVVPFLLALLIAVLAAGPTEWLRRKGLPLWLAITCVLVALLLIQLVLAVLLGATVNEFTGALPQYQARLRELTGSIAGWLGERGIDLDQTRITDILDPGAAMRLANNLLVGLGNLLGDALLIMFTALFMLLEFAGIPAKLAAIKGPRGAAAAARLAEAANSTKRYMGLKTLTSLATGMLIYAGVAVIGLDFAPLWALLAFGLNFVPTIGSIIAAVPAVLLSLVQLGLFPTLAIVAVYVVVNTVIGNMVEPTVMGRQVGLSTLVVFLSLVFWGWMLGPVGMFLSVPLTIALRFAAAASDETRWIAIALGPSPVEDPLQSAPAPPDGEQERPWRAE